MELLAEEKRFFLVMLKLFEFGIIDIEEWKNEQSIIEDCQGEFDLSYALGQIYIQNARMYGIKKITVSNTGKLIELKCICQHYKLSVETDNLLFMMEADYNA